jgi:RHS repeat-associated protein
VLQVSDPTGSYGFAYDNMGRLIGTSTQYSFLPGITSLTAPDGSTTSYTYDTLNRLNGLANSWAGSFGFGYDALSRRTSLTRPNGVNTNYSYDPLSRLLSVLHQSGTTVLDGAAYTYDNDGNRTSKTNYLNGTTSNYSYDPLYELTQVTQGGSTTESYSYDPVGNRLSSMGTPSYSYNSSNELTASSAGSYTYDANGNTLSDAQGRSYTWDFENRLTQVVVPGTNSTTAGTTTFKYDPFGRRIQKSSPTWAGGFVYDGDNLIETVNSNGTLVARYAQGLKIDEPLADFQSGGTGFYEADDLGSITSLSSSAGMVTNTYAYDSLGNTTASTGTLRNYFRYTAREFDPETGLYFYRARYYDPNVGRFTAEDSARWRGGLNFYPYVFNRPVNATDPSGRWTTNIGGTLTCSFGGWNFTYTGGFVFDSGGNVGVYNTGGGGSIGAGCFFGVNAGASTAQTICGFGGPFFEYSGNAGYGAGGGYSYYTGYDTDYTPVVGSSLSVGVGGGADVTADLTKTWVTPLNGKCCE